MHNGMTKATLFEHNEMTRFGSRPTACPSDRIPWSTIITEAKKIIEQEDDMKEYRMFQTWAPAKLWLICYTADVPIYRRWITTQAGAQKLIAAHGEPETISGDQLLSIPAL